MTNHRAPFELMKVELDPEKPVCSFEIWFAPELGPFQKPNFSAQSYIEHEFVYAPYVPMQTKNINFNIVKNRKPSNP